MHAGRAHHPGVWPALPLPTYSSPHPSSHTHLKPAKVAAGLGHRYSIALISDFRLLIISNRSWPARAAAYLAACTRSLGSQSGESVEGCGAGHALGCARADLRAGGAGSCAVASACCSAGVGGMDVLVSPHRLAVAARRLGARRRVQRGFGLRTASILICSHPCTHRPSCALSVCSLAATAAPAAAFAPALSGNAYGQHLARATCNAHRYGVYMTESDGSCAQQSGERGGVCAAARALRCIYFTENAP